MFALWVALSLQGPGGPELSTDALTDALAKMHARTGGSIIVDLTAVPGVLPKGESQGDLVWRELARLWGRDMMVMPTSLLLRVSDPLETERAQRRYLADWLRSLPADQLESFRAGRVSFKSLPSRASDAVAALLPGYKALLNEETTISFGREAMVLYTGADGQRTNELLRTGNVGFAPPDRDLPAVVPERPGAVPREAEGKLSFAKGVRLSVLELSARAGRAFGVRYQVDPRIWEQPVFVAGHWTRPTFERAIAEITTIAQVKPEPVLTEMDADYAKLIDPSHPTDPIRSLKSGRTTLGAVLGAVPGGLRRGASLPPSTPADLTNRLGFYVHLKQPGSNVGYAMFIPL